MDRWLRPGCRGGAGGREREGNVDDGRATGRTSPARSLRDQGKILWTKPSGAAAEDRSFVLETGDKASSCNPENVRASFRANGRPMKVLNENQMSKEEDTRSKSPSVIARLMGFDSLPVKSSADKQQNISESTVVGSSNTVKLHKFRDQPGDRVFSKQKRKDGEVKFSRQNQKHEDHLSTDENLHHSRETGHGLYGFDSNKDFFLRFLRGHTPLLSSKHLQDPTSFSSTEKPTHITVLRPSKGTKVRGGEFPASPVPGIGVIPGVNGMQRDGAIVQGSGSGSPVVTNSVQQHLLPELKLRKLKVVRKHEPCIHPAHIIVLKPNLNNLQDNEKVLSPHNSLPNFRRIHREHSCTSGISTMFTQVDNPKHEFSQMNEPSELCRGIAIKAESTATEIVAQFYHQFLCFQRNESSKNESDICYIDGWKTYRPMLLHTSKSSISGQDKRYASDQWATSQKPQDAGLLLSQGTNTIDNMLSAAHLQMKNNNFLDVEDRRGDVLLCARNKDSDTRHLRSQPIDGAVVHADSSFRKVPRRTSLSIPSSISENNSLQNYYLNSMFTTRGRHISDVSIINDRRPVRFDSRREATEPPFSGVLPSSSDLLRTHFSPIKKSGYTKPSSAVVGGATTLDDEAQGYNLKERENSLCKATVIADINDRKHDCSSALKEVAPIHCLPNLSRLNASSRKPHLTIKIEGNENSSPVSVLESAEERDPISLQCFSDLNAELNELRIQLDLLKLETPKSRTEGPQLVCNESDIEDDSVLLQEEDAPQFCNDEEERDFSYLLGILTDSRLGGVGMDMIFNACYSLVSPVDPNEFEKLENAFDEPEVWSRAERKLLFDLVNSVLSEELAPNIDLHPWVQPCRIAGLVRRRKLVAEDVWKALVRKRKELEVRQAKPIPEVSWLDVRDDIDMIGRDIEKMLREDLLDELVVELITV